MGSRIKWVVGAAIGMFAVGAADAGTSLGTSTQNLWGVNYATETWFVGQDSPTIGGDLFEPEGMTLYDGTLYVSGDADEADPALVSYTPGAAGALVTPTLIPMTLVQGDRYGAEGITVNPSGASFGAFTGLVPTLVSVESGTETDAVERVAATIEVGTAAPAPVTNVHAPTAAFDPDGIAYVSSLDQFAVINDPSRIDFYNHDATTLTAAGDSFFPFIVGVGDAKGLASISASFAEFLSGETVLTDNALLIAHESNHLSLWQTDGTQIGQAIEFTSGLLPKDADESEIESIAVDELNQLIFVGDEAGLSITTIFVPEPTTLALLVAGGLLMARRTRG